MKMMRLYRTFLRAARISSAVSQRNISSARNAPIALVFDTETTGMVNFKQPPTDASQPHLVQLGLLLVDTSDWSRRMQTSVLVQLDEGVEIEPGAQETHKISKEDCLKYGVSPSTATQIFRDALQQADLLVAHNLAFDTKVMDTALFRYSIGSIQNITKNQTIEICTMQQSTNVLRLPGRNGNNFKWPSLQQAYTHFCEINGKDEGDSVIVGAHDALTDAEACLTIFRGLVETGEVRLDEVEQDSSSTTTTSTSRTLQGDPDVILDPAQRSFSSISTPDTSFGSFPPPPPPPVARPGELIISPDPDGGFVVRGNTFAYKDYLKYLGARWNPRDKVWSFGDMSKLQDVKRLAGILEEEDGLERFG